MTPNYPQLRLRRLRGQPILRAMIRETILSADDFILPLFVRGGKNIRNEISSMPGHYQFSVDTLLEEVDECRKAGVSAFILFGIPESKDATGAQALREDGIVAQAVQVIKTKFPDVLVITDECFCEYTDHGHCGILSENTGRLDVDNDATLEILAKQCVVHARAGADVVAPSGMLDGMVQAIRKSLDSADLSHIPIMSYAAKYASAFYGPFREAAESPPQFGDRTSYQMDPANSDEAMREIELDVNEGADIIMVKPALPYLDIIQRAKERFSMPLAAYNVSGEFAMVKAAAQRGWVDEQRIILELLTSIKRAGADMILTYHAKEAAQWLAAGRVS